MGGPKRIPFCSPGAAMESFTRDGSAASSSSIHKKQKLERQMHTPEQEAPLVDLEASIKLRQDLPERSAADYSDELGAALYRIGQTLNDVGRFQDVEIMMQLYEASFENHQHADLLDALLRTGMGAPVEAGGPSSMFQAAQLSPEQRDQWKAFKESRLVEQADEQPEVEGQSESDGQPEAFEQPHMIEQAEVVEQPKFDEQLQAYEYPEDEQPEAVGAEVAQDPAQQDVGLELTTVEGMLTNYDNSGGASLSQDEAVGAPDSAAQGATNDDVIVIDDEDDKVAEAPDLAQDPMADDASMMNGENDQADGDSAREAPANDIIMIDDEDDGPAADATYADVTPAERDGNISVNAPLVNFADGDDDDEGGANVDDSMDEGEDVASGTNEPAVQQEHSHTMPKAIVTSKTSTDDNGATHTKTVSQVTVPRPSPAAPAPKTTQPGAQNEIVEISSDSEVENDAWFTGRAQTATSADGVRNGHAANGQARTRHEAHDENKNVEHKGRGKKGKQTREERKAYRKKKRLQRQNKAGLDVQELNRAKAERRERKRVKKQSHLRGEGVAVSR